MANNRIAVLVALDAADDGLKRAISSAEKSLGELSASAKTAGDKATAGMAEVKAGMSAFGDQVATAKTQLLAFLSINWAAGKVQEIVQIADAWNGMTARLKLATAGQNEFAAAQKALFDIAQRIGVPIQETATLYGKLQQAVRMLGLEQKDALSITESISQALRLSGATATEAQSALLQFGQALAGGVLRGEEFNSVVENSPRLAKALADGLNVPIGRLRKMAEEGRLTADVVVNALMSQKDKLAAEYGQLPITVGQSFERLRNAFALWVSQVDASTGFTKKLADAMTYLSQNLDSVMQWLKNIAELGLAVLAYRLIPALITAWQTVGAAGVAAAQATSAAWTTANLSLSGAVASAGLLKTAFAVLGAFFAGWEIGTWLSEKFEFVRKAGIAMVEVLVRSVEELRYRWEVFAAIFTSDTIAEATKRHEARLADMRQIFSQMYADAAKSTAAVAGAMTAAASSAEEISRRLEAVRQGTQEAVGRGVEAVHGALEKLKTRIGEVESQFNKANQTVTDATGKMAEAYKTFTTMVESGLQRQTDAVKERYAQEAAALAQSSQSEAAQIAKSVQLVTESLAQQTSLRQKATAETLKLIEDESKAKLQAAQRDGVNDTERAANVKRVENDLLATKRQTLAQATADYRAHIDALNSEANRHLTEVKRIEEEKRRLALSTEDRIREIQRQGMTDFEATEDRKRQIVELQDKARVALEAGRFDQAKAFAQQAIELSAQVASSQTSDAQRAQTARTQAEQDLSRVTELETKAREAARQGELATARQLTLEAEALRAEIAQKTKDADSQISVGKEGVASAIGKIRESEELLNKALDGESKAHKDAAASALSARDEIQRTLTQTETQIDQITAKLKDGLKVTLDADATRLTKALEDLDKAIAEKERLVVIKADLEQAQKQLQEYELLLKEGKTLPVNADVSKAKEALANLKTYAEQNSQLELKVATEKAQAAITNVEGMIRALDRIQTESRHQVATNVDAARAEIRSLDGMNTSSTHTITVQKVEANATGGLVGAGVARFASGGPVFPSMNGGTVPGTGDGDTVPRRLQAGAYVLRKDAVRKYGAGTLSRLANRVARFASGGPVSPPRLPELDFLNDFRSFFLPTKRNRDVVEAMAMIDLGLVAMRDYTNWVQATYGARVSLDYVWKTMRTFDAQAVMDRNRLNPLIGRKQLTTHEQQQLERVRQIWRNAMAKPLEYGRDVERDLIAFMEENAGTFYRAGGLSSSDTVPALLTPGEYVVNKDAVTRFGTGFFAAINNLSLPAKALAQRVQGFAAGGFVAPLGAALLRPELGDGMPSRTVRIEFAAGSSKVAATIDARDETRLLDLLKVAQARAI